MGYPFKLYDQNGYVTFDELLPYAVKNGISFIIIIGGRGTGKTFGILKTLYENKLKFLYLRRKQTQIDMQVNPEFNPFIPINKMYGYKVTVEKLNKLMGAFYNGEYNDENELKPSGPPIGLLGALSTFSSSRGIDGSDIKCIFFDEFLREPHEKAMKNEGDIFSNVYETINRNRELMGEKPLLAILASNENYSESDIMNNFHVYEYMDRMKEKEIYIDKQKGIIFIYQKTSKISQQKAFTALYKAGASKRIYEMAIANISEDLTHRVINLKPSGIAWCEIEGIGTIYRMKLNGDTILYVTNIVGACHDKYGNNNAERARLLREKASILFYESIDKIYYQSIHVKMNLKEIIQGL